MCWLTDVIIPIICALIGGGLTMWGVQRTLKAQRIESDHIRIQEAKPYLWSILCRHLRGTAFRMWY